MDPLLLFADDGSTGADTAWQWVCAQEWPGWRVEVITVEALGVSHAEPQLPREWSPSEPRTAPGTSGIGHIRHLVADGDARSILAELPADLLVIGSRGKGLLKSMHIGSVAEYLLDCPSAPLVLAKGDKPVRSVLLAVDGSNHAGKATRVLAQLPWIAHSRVVILGVDEGDGVAAQAVDAAARVLAEHAYAVDRRTIEHDPLALTVNVRQELERYIAEHDCDLVVAGTQGLTGLPRVRLGSVADYLAHHVDCPVLLVRDANSD